MCISRHRLIYIYPVLFGIRRILQAVSDIRAAWKRSVYAPGEGSDREKGRDDEVGREEGREREREKGAME